MALVPAAKGHDDPQKGPPRAWLGPKPPEPSVTADAKGNAILDGQPCTKVARLPVQWCGTVPRQYLPRCCASPVYPSGPSCPVRSQPRASVLYCTSNPAGRSSGQRKSPVLFLLPSQGWLMPVLGSPRPRIGLALYGLDSGSVLTKALALHQGRPVPRTSPMEALHRRNRLSPCSNRARLQPAGGGQPPRSGRQRPGGALTGHLSLYRVLEIDETERGLAASIASWPLFFRLSGAPWPTSSCSMSRGCPVPSSRSTKVNKVAVAGIIRQVELPVGPRCLGRNGTPPPLFGWGATNPRT